VRFDQPAVRQWPPGTGKFFLHEQGGKKRGEGSGVKPIKNACIANLKKSDWDLELDRIDATKDLGNGVPSPVPLHAHRNDDYVERS